MERISFDELRSFATRLDGQTLVTRFRGLKFHFHVTQDGFEYTPESTGKRRRQEFRYAERVLTRYNETRSLHPVDYNDISINASYFLAVLGSYLDSLVAPDPR